MTAPSLHEDSTLRVEALHLSVTQTYPSGGVHNVHVMDAIRAAETCVLSPRSGGMREGRSPWASVGAGDVED